MDIDGGGGGGGGVFNKKKIKTYDHANHTLKWELI